MQFLRRVQGWLNPTKNNKAQQIDYKAKMQLVRKAYFDERYEDAQNLLEEAIEHTNLDTDSTARVDVTLTRADILIAQGEYKNAEILLNELQLDSEGKHHQTPLAYALSSLGMIAQRQGDLELARERYEKARTATENIKAEGATGRAMAHLADTYLQEDNASYALYLLKDAVPMLQNSGDKELLGYFLGLWGEAQIKSGYHDEGIEKMRRGYEVAASMQHKTHMRIITGKLGQSYFDMGKYQRAQHYLDESIKLYSEARHTSENYIALLILASTTALRIQDTLTAKQYAATALTLSEQAGRSAQVRMAKALKLLSDPDANKTEADLQQLISFANTLSNHDANIYLQMQQKIASLQESLGQLTEARSTYSNIIALGDKIQQAEAHAGIAHLLTESDELREAIEAHQQAADLYSSEGRYGQVAQQYCAMGLLYSRLGDGRMALRPYGDALLIINRIDESTIRGAVLACVANAYSDYGDIESALDFYTQAIDIAKEASQKAAEAIRRGNYGRLLALTGKSQHAIIEITQAHTYFMEQKLALEIAIQESNLGIAHRTSGDADTALVHHQKARAYVTATDNPTWLSIIYADLADTEIQAGQYDSAMTHYEKALELAEEAVFANGVIQSTIGQINCLIAQDKIDEAVPLIEDIESALKRAYLRRYLAQWYEARSRVHQARGDADSAKSTWEEAQTLRKTMQMPEIEASWLTS